MDILRNIAWNLLAKMMVITFFVLTYTAILIVSGVFFWNVIKEKLQQRNNKKLTTIIPTNLGSA